MKFQVGDRVRVKCDKDVPEVAGTVVSVCVRSFFPIEVKWDRGVTWWHSPHELEFAETPIQRMRRLYSET